MLHLWVNEDGITSECQTAWIHIRPNILLSLIWVQTKIISRRRLLQARNIFCNTVNSEIFARVLLSRNFANGEITLSFVNMAKSCPSHEILKSQICLYAIRQNKILTKISEFTVLPEQLLLTLYL